MKEGRPRGHGGHSNPIVDRVLPFEHFDERIDKKHPENRVQGWRWAGLKTGEALVGAQRAPGWKVTAGTSRSKSG
jgi:hypothetical protein